jgi:hypothetical protein
MLPSFSGLARKAAFAGVCLLAVSAATGCQGAQTTPTARPTAATSNAQSANQSAAQLFGGQLPSELPQDPAAGFGSVSIIQGTTFTLTTGRGAFGGGQAPDGRTPGARVQDSQTPQAQGQAGQGGQFQGGQGQRGQGAQGGQGQGAFGAGSASVVTLSADTKYFKAVSVAPSGTPGAVAANPQGGRPQGTPQAGGAPQGGRSQGTPQAGGAPQGAAPEGQDAAPPDGGSRFPGQFAMTVEPGAAADLQVGSLVMVWGSVIDGRVYADVVYIMNAGPGR